MVEYIKINGMVKSIRPIIHSSNGPDEGVLAQGNQSFLRKIKVHYEGESVLVPVISGNSIRGVMRRLGADSLLSMLGMNREAMSRKLVYLLFNGGALEQREGRGKRKFGREDPEGEVSFPTDDLRRLLPLLSLFGCAYQQRILQGKLIVDFLVPYVDEVAELYGKDKPGLRAAQVTDWLFYTRTDDEERREREANLQMIYQMEYILPNIDFLHSFTLMGPNEIERSLFVHILELFSQYGFVGGKLAQGHGKIQCEYEYRAGESAQQYLDFIHEHKAEILHLLNHLSRGK